MSDVIVDNILHFNAGTRLQCPNCLLVSNNHNLVDLCQFVYTIGHSKREYIASYHSCKSCGTTDAPWDGKGGEEALRRSSKQFIDSGNYQSYNFDNDEMNEAEKKVKELKAELEYYTEVLRAGTEEFERIWHTDKDVII